MSTPPKLDTTENIVHQFEIDYHACSEEIVDSIFNCVAHKTDFIKREGHRPSLCPQWEGGQPILDARESLLYRLGSLVWHVRMIYEQQHKFSHIISELKISGQNFEDKVNDANSVMSYLMDNVIFNSISVFDYLSFLIYQLDFPEHRGEKTWSKLLNRKQLLKLEHPELATLLETVNNDWVYKLSRLRGSIIHVNAEISNSKITTNFTPNSIEHSFEYFMPDSVIKALPIFGNCSIIGVYAGTALIALHTVNRVRLIIELIGKLEYECVYNPFSNT